MFLHNSIRLSQRNINNKFISSISNPTFWNSTSKRLLSTNSSKYFSKSAKSVSSKATSLALFLGASLTITLHSHSKIFNEVANLGTIEVKTNPFAEPKLVDTEKIRNPTTSRFGGKLQYKQLSYGSLIGVFTGVIIGKLSTVLGFIAFSSFLLLQFLQSRGIIHVPWTSVIQVGRDKIDIRQLLLEDPSFKISFFLTFIIAAVSI